MGYGIMMGFCAACRRFMQFNPLYVPSLRINGVKEPLCETCANRWNEIHKDNVQPIHPKAYEPFDEYEV